MAGTGVEFLLALFVDPATCKPFTGPGRIGHVVRVSQNPDMTIVNEFTSGGPLAHVACAPAALQSYLLDRTPIRTTMHVLEMLSGTHVGPDPGTQFTGIINAGRHFGLEIKFSGDNPSPGHIMNPGGFANPVDVSAFPSYLAASQGGCLVLPSVGAPLFVSDPHHPSPEESEMPKLGLFIATDVDGVNAVFISDGMHFRHVPGPTATVPKPLPDEQAVVGPWFNGDGVPLRLWNQNPVADVSAFGVPADAASAKLLGLPFP